MPDDFAEEPEDLDRPPPFFPYEPGDGEPRPESFGEPVQVQVEAVFAAQVGSQVQRFVLLSDGERKLPIVIGPFEASSISMSLENATPDRPLTHDLVKNLVERLGGTVVRVVIDDLLNSTYYAKLYVQKGKELMEIDSRPSDAIAIAVRFECPIFVADGILNYAGDQGPQ